MLAAAPPIGGEAGVGVPRPRDTGTVAEFAVTPTGAAGSGLPMLTAGAAPRTAPVLSSPPPPGEGEAGEIASPVMRNSRGFSEVAVSPLAIAAVLGAVYVAGKAGIGPDEGWATALLGGLAPAGGFGEA
jgi:hypothetical protein